MGAGQVHRGELSRARRGPPATTEVQSSSSPRDSGLVLTPAGAQRDGGGGGDPGQEKAGEGGGDSPQRSAQGEEWSTSPGHLSPEERKGGVCWGGKAGPARLRGGGGGEKGQCTWSQPSSFPSPLPGSPRLPRTPWFPRPPHPCAQPLQKRLLQALATPPRLVLLRWPRMLLPLMAGPRRAGLPLCLLKLLLAAMTAPRAAGRGVRVRERAG